MKKLCFMLYGICLLSTGLASVAPVSDPIAPVHLESLMLCSVHADEVSPQQAYVDKKLLVGWLTNSMSRDLIGELRSSRRPACFNANFWHFIKSRTQAKERLVACCRNSDCELGNTCYYLTYPVDLDRGTVVSLCVPDLIAPSDQEGNLG